MMRRRTEKQLLPSIYFESPLAAVVSAGLLIPAYGFPHSHDIQKSCPGLPSVPSLRDADCAPFRRRSGIQAVYHGSKGQGQMGPRMEVSRTMRSPLRSRKPKWELWEVNQLWDSGRGSVLVFTGTQNREQRGNPVFQYLFPLPEELCR